MPLDVDVLRESFALVAERAPDLTSRFYDVLFRRYPQAQPLFGRNTRARQEQMLTEALVAVLDHVENAAWLTETLQALGAKHVAYGVTDEMYDWVGDSLLITLAEVAGDAWTPRVARAWKDAYGAIAGLMMEGARLASAKESPRSSKRPPEMRAAGSP
jgi:hemoglobin-like flavoprotein